MYNSVHFDLETITPLFMAGADGRTPELRPPSFKGMIRFWWRAMRADGDIKNLAEEEAKLFGGTGEREGKSNVNLKFFINSGWEKQVYEEYPLPHKPKFSSLAVKPGQQFKCIMRFRRPKSKGIITSSFQLALLLGGFGKRSRRGFGSIAETTCNFQNINDVVIEIEELRQKIVEQNPFAVKEMKELNTTYIQLSRGINKRTPGYPRILEIYIGRTGFENSKDLLFKISKSSSDCCDKALGSGKPRMASPVVVSVIRIGSKYYPIITKLSSHFEDSYPVDKKGYEEKQDAFIMKIL